MKNTLFPTVTFFGGFSIRHQQGYCTDSTSSRKTVLAMFAHNVAVSNLVKPQIFKPKIPNKVLSSHCI